MTQLLPAPGNHDDDSVGGPGRRAGPRSQRKQITIPSVDEILRMLLQLNSAVTIGVMSPSDANIVHRNLRTILDVQMKRAERNEGGPGHEALIELCRRDPTAINILAPFLTDDALDALMREIGEAPDGPV